MRLLLDTHILLWWLDDSSQLAVESRDLIADPENTIFVSVVSIWEIRIKQSIGKIDLPEGFDKALRDSSFELLSIDARHANAIARLPMLHRDPFDRMLLAQAIVENLVLLTADPALAQYEAPVKLVLPR